MRAGYTGDALFTNATERTYYFCSVVIFRWAIMLEAVIMIIDIIMLHRRYHFSVSHWFDFLFKNGRIRVLEIQVTLSLLILIGLCIKIFLHHPLLLCERAVMNVLVILISIIDFFFGFFALFSAREFISVPEIRTAFRFNYTPETEEDVAEEIITSSIPLLHTESLARVHSRLEMQASAEINARNAESAQTPTLTTSIFGAVTSANADEASLLARFQHLMMEEKLFLRPSLTLSDVAERLHTNKTYVSKMVNRSYNLGFPEVLNILRVDYAEHFIRKHRDATQDEIARACGFLSASSFNSTFKRITGYTPKVWAARTSSKKV